MKKTIFSALGLTLILSACMPTFFQPTAAPAPQVDLNATADVLVQASLAAQPTPTQAPSKTPVVVAPSETVVPLTPSETQSSILLTLTATLGTGTVTAGSSVSGGTPTVTGISPGATAVPAINTTPSTTQHPRFYGTLPPKVPFGFVTLINRSKAQAYISLQCTTVDGYTTIIEYPVKKIVKVEAPAGRYIYVAWVGGNKMVGEFKLDTKGTLTLTMYKDKITLGK